MLGRDTHNGREQEVCKDSGLLMPLGFAVEISHIQGCPLFLIPGQKKDEFPAAHCAARDLSSTCTNREH